MHALCITDVAEDTHLRIKFTTRNSFEKLTFIQFTSRMGNYKDVSGFFFDISEDHIVILTNLNVKKHSTCVNIFRMRV